MSASSTSGIFGEDEGGVLATPGSYGEAPAGYRLPEATHLGHVVLQVADLARSTDWYQDVLGLRLTEADGGRAVLGAADGVPLVELRERRGARPMVTRGRLGLFHFAILLPDRASLGRLVAHFSERGVRAGAGDHLVSEAFYLQDPDNLGIEVYADRPRDTWRRVGRQLMMATDPVDVRGLVELAGAQPWRGMPAGTVMGHVHLHVGDIPAASAFYSDALGFDRMVWSYPGALFLGAGGYHHHLGTNVWAGSGALSPEANDVQLLEWRLVLPAESDLEQIAGSLRERGLTTTFEAPATEFVVRDPWGTMLRVSATIARI